MRAALAILLLACATACTTPAEQLPTPVELTSCTTDDECGCTDDCLDPAPTTETDLMTTLQTAIANANALLTDVGLPTVSELVETLRELANDPRSAVAQSIAEQMLKAFDKPLR
jgi:hypothetical protein